MLSTTKTVSRVSVMVSVREWGIALNKYRVNKAPVNKFGCLLPTG